MQLELSCDRLTGAVESQCEPLAELSHATPLAASASKCQLHLEGVFGRGLAMVVAAKKTRVFVVDDEESIALTIAMILRGYGFDARFFTHANEALQAALVDCPQLLVTDVLMPELTGFDLAAKIQEINPSCKVLLFTGQPGRGRLLFKTEAADLGFELLEKPVHPSVLVAKVQRLMPTQPAGRLPRPAAGKSATKSYR